MYANALQKTLDEGYTIEDGLRIAQNMRDLNFEGQKIRTVVSVFVNKRYAIPDIIKYYRMSIMYITFNDFSSTSWNTLCFSI